MTSRDPSLRNQEQIASELVRRFGFELADADNLTIDQQVDLFAEATFVVAVHGAGLTNLIHRVGAPTRLIELFPHNYIRPHFAWLARTAGYAYTAAVGSYLRRGADDFEVALGDVLNAIERIGSR